MVVCFSSQDQNEAALQTGWKDGAVHVHVHVHVHVSLILAGYFFMRSQMLVQYEDMLQKWLVKSCCFFVSIWYEDLHVQCVWNRSEQQL